MDEMSQQDSKGGPSLVDVTSLRLEHILSDKEKGKFLELQQQVIECLVQVTGNEEEYNFSDSMEAIGLNSIEFIKLVVLLEEKFGFNFEDDELVYTLYPDLNSLFYYIYRKFTVMVA